MKFHVVSSIASGVGVLAGLAAILRLMVRRMPRRPGQQAQSASTSPAPAVFMVAMPPIYGPRFPSLAALSILAARHSNSRPILSSSAITSGLLIDRAKRKHR
jgi:hypothetical protein